MSDNATLVKHIRNISRYEGITDGQASVLRAGANALEQADRELAEARAVITEAQSALAYDGERHYLERIYATTNALNSLPIPPAVGEPEREALVMAIMHHPWIANPLEWPEGYCPTCNKGISAGYNSPDHAEHLADAILAAGYRREPLDSTTGENHG